MNSGDFHTIRGILEIHIDYHLRYLLLPLVCGYYDKMEEIDSKMMIHMDISFHRTSGFHTRMGQDPHEA